MLDLTSIAALALSVIDAGIFGFGAYWAWEFRSAFASPLYRRQALWVAAIASYFAVYFVVVATTMMLGVGPLAGTAVPRIAASMFVYLGVTMFFIWIDSTVKLARRSDPLRRDTLSWSKLRWFFGLLVVIGTFFALVETPAYSFTQATPIFGPIGVTLLVGAAVLYVSGRRSGDPLLKAHLRWFGYFAAILWVTSVIEGSSLARSAAASPLVDAVSYAAFWISAYFLYRSARDIAPLSPVPLGGGASKGKISNRSP